MTPKSKTTTPNNKTTSKKAENVKQTEKTGSKTEPTRSLQPLIDAVGKLDKMLTLNQTRQTKTFTDALQTVHSQLVHHHTKTQFITLNRDMALVFKKLFDFVAQKSKNIQESDVDMIQLTTSVLAYAIPLPMTGGTVKSANILPKMTKSQKMQQNQSEINPLETAQHVILSELVGGITDGKFVSNVNDLVKNKFLTPILNLITVYTPPANKTAVFKKTQILSSLLTLLQQGLKWANFIKNDFKIEKKGEKSDEKQTQDNRHVLLTEFDTEDIYIKLNLIFTAYVDDQWGQVTTRIQCELISMIVEVISTLIAYHSPQSNDETESKPTESDNNQFVSTIEQTMHVNNNPLVIKSICNMVFNTLCSIIMSTINHQHHPLVALFSPQNATASQINTDVFDTISHQIFNIAHYISVCYVDYFTQRSISTLPPQDQAQLYQSEQNPYGAYISADLLQLLTLFLRHQDEGKLLSVEDEKQSAIRRIMVVIMGSGSRFDMVMMMRSGYFEFLLSLVWDSNEPTVIKNDEKNTKKQLTGKLRKSAVLLRPDLTTPKTPEQRAQLEELYMKQVAIEVNRVTFFTLQLDIFILFSNMGYSSRYLLITQYDLLRIIVQVLQFKVFGMDQLMRKQNSVVEKIALFLKNFISPMSFYYEFDYTMYFQMAGIEPFPELKTKMFDYLNLKLDIYDESKQNDEQNQTVVSNFEQRISDDVYSIFLYDLYQNHQLNEAFEYLYPSLCLYYTWPVIDVEKITAGMNSIDKKDGNNSESPTENSDKQLTASKKAANLDQDMQQMIKYAQFQAAAHQQTNSFIIASDMINYSVFLPNFHLFSYIPSHYTHKIYLNNRTGPSSDDINMAFSPIQLSGFTTAFKNNGDEFSVDKLVKDFHIILKNVTKNVICGLYNKNASNDDPSIHKKDVNVTPETDNKGKKNGNDVENDENVENKKTEQEIKIDALVAQVIQFTYSFLNNKDTKKDDTIPEQLKFVGFRTHFQSPQQFLTKCFPGEQFKA